MSSEHSAALTVSVSPETQPIADALTSSLNTTLIEIVDNSAQHAGHVGYHAGVATHVAIRVASDAFEGKSPLDRHRMVFDALAPLRAQYLHAIELKTCLPQAW
jgi:BolA family transcriptional regulator, general stress-responsive regulator